MDHSCHLCGSNSSLEMKDQGNMHSVKCSSKSVVTTKLQPPLWVKSKETRND